MLSRINREISEMSHKANQPLVTAIIPTHNRAEIIPISLESVIRQTHRNLEIIVVDDSSSDNTETVVKSIQDPRVTYLRHSKNRGGAAARNTGIDAANGDFIAFLDSDDAWVPHKVERQLKHIYSVETPGNVVSYTQVFHSLEGITEKTYSAFDPKYYIPKEAKLLNESIAEYLFCSKGKTLTSTLMMPRQLALKTHFRDDFKKHQDWDFCIRLEAGGATFRFIAEPLTIWNGDPSFSHVGQIVDYEFSEAWLKECRSYISDRAATAFYLDKIIPYLMKKGARKGFCQRTYLDALLQNQIRFRKFIKLSKQIWV